MSRLIATAVRITENFAPFTVFENQRDRDRSFRCRKAGNIFLYSIFVYRKVLFLKPTYDLAGLLIQDDGVDVYDVSLNGDHAGLFFCVLFLFLLFLLFSFLQELFFGLRNRSLVLLVISGAGGRALRFRLRKRTDRHRSEDQCEKYK